METLDELTLSDNDVNAKMTWDGQQKSYSYPVATTTFGFEPRANGAGTANESITAEKWDVYYNNGTLHVSNPVGTVSIYGIGGKMIGQYLSQSEISVSLNPGFYIVVSGKHSAKLLVTENGYGGTTTRSTAVETQAATLASASSQINLRASTIKIFWNIIAGNSTIAVEISDVEKFHFTVDNTIVFTQKNGNTLEMADYQGA